MSKAFNLVMYATLAGVLLNKHDELISTPIYRGALKRQGNIFLSHLEQSQKELNRIRNEHGEQSELHREAMGELGDLIVVLSSFVDCFEQAVKLPADKQAVFFDDFQELVNKHINKM